MPLTAVNMPYCKVFRTFPQKVKVNFTVGASMFRSITADQFSVIVDYNEIVQHPSDKCAIHLNGFPRGVKNARMQVAQVDYLIEQQ